MKNKMLSRLALIDRSKATGKLHSTRVNVMIVLFTALLEGFCKLL